MITRITISDPVLLEQIAKAPDAIEFCRPDGTSIAVVTAGWGKLPPGVKSPLSHEEFERRRQEAGEGRSLKEIISDLEKRVA